MALYNIERIQVQSAAEGWAPFNAEDHPKGQVQGTLVEYDADSNSYIVGFEGSSGIPAEFPEMQIRGVPRKTDNPGFLAPLLPGSEIIVNFGLGFPYIDGVLGLESSRALATDGPPPPRLGGDGDVSVQANLTSSENGEGEYYREPGTPPDALPGDVVQTGPGGNYIGVLQGKHTVLFGSPYAKVSAFGSHDLIQIKSENYEHYSSLGTLSIYNEEGRANLKFRAGADQQAESRDGNWTFKLDIGDEGNLFNMEITDDYGRTKSKINLDPSGKITLIGTKGVDIVSTDGGIHKEEIGGDKATKVGGDVRKTVEGDTTHVLEGNKQESISEGRKMMVGSNDSATINANKIVSVGGSTDVTYSGGDIQYANPANVAVDEKVLNGSYVVHVGYPPAASPAAKSSYRIAVYHGDVTLGEGTALLDKPSQKVSVNLNTLQPDSVALGGTCPMYPETSKNVAVMHAMLYEPWYAMFNTLLTVLDTHTHGTAWGPSAPAAVFHASADGALTGIQSKRVLIGL